MRIKSVIAFLLALFVVVSVAVVLRRQAVAGRASEPAPVKLTRAEAPLEAPRLEEPATMSVDTSIEDEPRPVGTSERERVEPTAS